MDVERFELDDTPPQAGQDKLLFSKFFPDLDFSSLSMMWELFWPTFLALIFQYSTNMVSVAFCGHLGQNQLGSVGLANSLIAITSIAIISGIASAGDTLGAQAYGAGNYKKVSLILHKGVLILGLTCFPIWAFWVNIDRVLILVKQPAAVARGAWLYLMVFSPGVLLMVLFRLLRSYVQIQGIVKPVALTCFLSFIVNILSNYVLIFPLKFGLVGAAVATNLTYFCLILTLAVYTYCSRVYVLTWTNPSKTCLTEWGSYLRLGLSGMAGELLLFSGNEIAIFLMGIVGKADLGAQTILFQVRTVLAMTSVGLSITLGIMTGRELGAGNPRRAKQVGKLGVLMGFLINCVLCSILFACKDKIGLLFSEDKDVLDRISSALPYMTISLFCFNENNICGGILLGCAKQKMFTVLFFVGSYVFGLPIGIVLTFVRELGIVGMWIGMAVGMFVQFALSVIYVFFCLDYFTASETARVESLVGSHEETPMEQDPRTYGSLETCQENACFSLQEKEAQKDTSNCFKDKVIFKRICALFVCIAVLLTSILIKVL